MGKSSRMEHEESLHVLEVVVPHQLLDTCRQLQVDQKTTVQGWSPWSHDTDLPEPDVTISLSKKSKHFHMLFQGAHGYLAEVLSNHWKCAVETVSPSGVEKKQQSPVDQRSYTEPDESSGLCGLSELRERNKASNHHPVTCRKYGNKEAKEIRLSTIPKDDFHKYLPNSYQMNICVICGQLFPAVHKSLRELQEHLSVKHSMCWDEYLNLFTTSEEEADRNSEMLLSGHGSGFCEEHSECRPDAVGGPQKSLGVRRSARKRKCTAKMKDAFRDINEVEGQDHTIAGRACKVEVTSDERKMGKVNNNQLSVIMSKSKERSTRVRVSPRQERWCGEDINEMQKFTDIEAQECLEVSNDPKVTSQGSVVPSVGESSQHSIQSDLAVDPRDSDPVGLNSSSLVREENSVLEHGCWTSTLTADVDSEVNFDQLRNADFVRHHRLSFERKNHTFQLKFILINDQICNKFFTIGVKRDREHAIGRIQKFIDTKAHDWLKVRYFPTEAGPAISPGGAHQDVEPHALHSCSVLLEHNGDFTDSKTPVDGSSTKSHASSKGAFGDGVDDLGSEVDDDVDDQGDTAQLRHQRVQVEQIKAPAPRTKIHCPVCSVGLAGGFRALRLHMQNLHKEEKDLERLLFNLDEQWNKEDPAPGPVVSCPYCGCTRTLARMQVHLSSCHGSEPDYDANSAKVTEEHPKAKRTYSRAYKRKRYHEGKICPVTKKYLCLYCGMGFLYRQSCIQHEKYRCDKNDKRILVHQCGICYHRSASLSEHAEHKATHVGKRPKLCDVCGKDFGGRSALSAHCRKVHKIINKLPIKMHKCDTCDKSFMQACRLRVHMEHHTDGKQHKCGACGHSYKTRKNLSDHTKLKHLERTHPFHCSRCLRGANSYDELRSHACAVKPEQQPHGSTQGHILHSSPRGGEPQNHLAPMGPSIDVQMTIDSQQAQIPQLTTEVVTILSSSDVYPSQEYYHQDPTGVIDIGSEQNIVAGDDGGMFNIVTIDSSQIDGIQNTVYLVNEQNPLEL